MSHASAARLWGWLEGSPGSPVDVTVVGANRGRRPGIRVHRGSRLDPEERSEREGIPLTAPARTLSDLAGVLRPRELEAAVARAEREGRVGRGDLRGELTRLHGRRGARSLRAVLEAQGGPALTRSEAEARFLALVRRARLPIPESNVRVGAYEVDFLWRDTGLAIEVDGYGYHASRPRFEMDRRRDAWLAAAGIQTLRLSWRQITEEAMATMVQLAQALARAGAPPA